MVLARIFFILFISCTGKFFSRYGCMCNMSVFFFRFTGVREFFFAAVVVCMSLFGTIMLAIYFFFQNHPHLPQMLHPSGDDVFLVLGNNVPIIIHYYLHVTSFIVSTAVPWTNLSSRYKSTSKWLESFILYLKKTKRLR